MKQLLLSLSLILFSHFVFAQKYQLKNENLVYSFNTETGKTLSICVDKDNKYIVYRFGTPAKVELEFPVKKDASSFKNFVYSYWLRGGGTANEGLDLNYLAFNNSGIKYVVYDNFYANENQRKVGIKIIQNGTQRDVPGLVNTKKGTLTDLRTIEELNKSDDLYEN